MSSPCARNHITVSIAQSGRIPAATNLSTSPIYQHVLSNKNGGREEGGDVYQPFILTSSMLKFSQKNSPTGLHSSEAMCLFCAVM